MLLDVHMEPTIDTIDRWVTDAFESNEIDRIRTGALFPAAAEAFRAAGFVEADRLALLERALDDRIEMSSSSDLVTSRLRSRDLELAADIDRASFPVGWQHDAESLRDIATATPQSRRRLIAPSPGHRSAVLRRHSPIGFAITGCAGPNGYLQRLAVHPASRRHGAARLLVDDALAWLMRRGARRAMVNTGSDNVAALQLYRDAGFDRLRDELVVAEFSRPA